MLTFYRSSIRARKSNNASQGLKIISFLILSLVLSCNSSRDLLNNGNISSYTCPGIVSLNNTEILDLSTLKGDSLLTAKYTSDHLHIANAFGLITDLQIYEHLRKKIKEDGKVDPNTFDEFTGAYNRINEGMNLAALEVKSLQDLLDCTILKLRKYKFQVTNANLKTQNRLSNWAIGVGSVTTIITAGILVSANDDLITSNAFDWMAVAGGVVTGYLAYRSARVNRQLRLNPQNNFIKVIWTGDNSSNLFPRSTWYLLNQPFSENGEETTLREIIINSWKESEVMLGTEENMALLPMLLADEAIYDEHLIDMRTEMLETIDLGIDQINRALYFFNSQRY